MQARHLNAPECTGSYIIFPLFFLGGGVIPRSPQTPGKKRKELRGREVEGIGNRPKGQERATVSALCLVVLLITFLMFYYVLLIYLSKLNVCI